MKFIHHFELIVHLYPTLHQLQFREGQITKVELIDFIFLCVWQLSLLCKEGSPVVGAHEALVGLSPAAPSPVPIPGLPRGSEQGGKGHTLRSQPPPHLPAPHMLGVHPVRVLPCSPGSQRVPLPRIPTAPFRTPLWFSATAQDSREKKNRLLHLRSNYASNFPFPFSSFLQSAFSGAHRLREAALHHSLMGKFKVLGFGLWGPACRFKLCHLLAELLNAFDPPFPHL